MSHKLLLILCVIILGLGACKEENSDNASVARDGGGEVATPIPVDPPPPFVSLTGEDEFDFESHASDQEEDPLTRWRRLQGGRLDRELRQREVIRPVEGKGGAVDAQQYKDRKLERIYNLTYGVDKGAMEERVQRDMDKCEEMGCEIIESNIEAERSATLKLRILPESLDAYLAYLKEGNGVLERNQITTKDQTLKYIDTAARLEKLESLKARLIELRDGDTARDLESVIKIEIEINSVDQQLDSLYGQLQHLMTVTDTISMTIHYRVLQEEEVRVPMYSAEGTWIRAKRDFVKSVSNMVVFSVSMLPWLPIWLFILWAGIKVIVLTFRKDRRFFKRFRVKEVKGDEKVKTKTPGKKGVKT